MTAAEQPKWSDLLGICPNRPGPAADVTMADVRERYMSDIRANEWGAGSYSMDDYGAAFDRAMAAHDAEVAAKALRDAADAWQTGGWANGLPKGANRAALILGMAQGTTTWLHKRAETLGVES